MIDDKPSLEEALAHHGIKGQKWGVRRGRGTTGVSRTRGQAIDRNDRTKKLLTDARAGKTAKVRVAVGKKLIGEKQWEKNFQTSMTRLNAQNKRLKSGKLTISDRADLFVTTNLFDLAVSRRPT